MTCYFCFTKLHPLVALATASRDWFYSRRCIFEVRPIITASSSFLHYIYISVVQEPQLREKSVVKKGKKILVSHL